MPREELISENKNL